MDKREDFLKKILASFKLEAQENIDSLYDNLIKLEKEDDEAFKKDLIEKIYRSAHSLKGASRAVSMQDIERVCHAFEDVMSGVREGIISLNTSIFDILHKTVDLIAVLLNSNADTEDEELIDRISNHIDLLALIETGENIAGNQSSEASVIDNNIVEDSKEVGKSLLVNEEDNTTDAEELAKKVNTLVDKTKSTTSSTIRVSNNKLDRLLFQTEKLLEIKLTSIERNNNLKDIVDKLYMWEREYENYNNKLKAIKRKVEEAEYDKIEIKSRDLSDMIDVLEWAGSSVKEMHLDIEALCKTDDANNYSTSVNIHNILYDVKNIITIPFSSLSNKFPKMVRDISKDLGKNVDFQIIGENIEIDRRVIEKIKDPLIHIIRNALDYGIEASSERIAKNKSYSGNITLRIERCESSNIQITLEDDGNGIDIDKVKNIIAKNKNIESITHEDCLNYIFKSGVSTSDIVTDISGRGIGLAIVWDNIDQLGGKVTVETEKDKYTKFIMNIPSSLLTYRGVIIDVSGNKYIIPTSKVEKVLKVDKSDIKSINNKSTISYMGNIISIVNLSDILSLNNTNTNAHSENILLLIFNNAGKNIAFIVDAVNGEQEVLIKKFNKQLTRVRYISGATVLGSGKVVPILNVSDVLKAACNESNITGITNRVSNSNIVETKSVLVVEDSVTSRMLLKNILESSGYVVDTAIDGVEGYTRLSEHKFDAVISDVEMPRMNGFELTEKIKKDDKTKSIPVILVTSLSKREHKEKGIDVGANAYIVKSSFDHSNLLEILESLI